MGEMSYSIHFPATRTERPWFYATVAERLEAEAKVRPQDVLIVLTQAAKENWFFGNGEAQYALPHSGLITAIQPAANTEPHDHWVATTNDHRWLEIGSAGTGRRQFLLVQTIFAGVATVAMLVLSQAAQPDGAKNVGASGLVRLADRATDLPNLVGTGGFAADGDDDEAQLQQQLAQQQMQQAEQQAEEQEQLDNQEAQQAEQQGLLTEQQANLSVPGS
jgi:hypothetical protein